MLAYIINITVFNAHCKLGKLAWSAIIFGTIQHNQQWCLSLFYHNAFLCFAVQYVAQFACLINLNTHMHKFTLVYTLHTHRVYHFMVQLVHICSHHYRKLWCPQHRLLQLHMQLYSLYTWSCFSLTDISPCPPWMPGTTSQKTSPDVVHTSAMLSLTGSFQEKETVLCLHEYHTYEALSHAHHRSSQLEVRKWSQEMC